MKHKMNYVMQINELIWNMSEINLQIKFFCIVNCNVLFSYKQQKDF